MATTVNMGLVKWTNLDDSYDHTELAGNFQAIDEHDHTTGKGVQIPTEGIADEAILTAKIADAAVTGSKLMDHTIAAVKLEKGVGVDLGDLKWWWRPNELLSLPPGGWEIADGRSLTASEHDFPGGGTVVLPNLIGNFIRGVELAHIGELSGASTYNLSHSHTVNSHTHGVPAHTHPVNIESGLTYPTNLKIAQNLEGSSWVHAGNSSGENHRHPVNGNTEATGVTSEGSSPGTDSKLSSSTTIVPPYIGLLPLIKVKNE